MNRAFGFGGAFAVLVAVAGCSGSAGPQGQQGQPGAPGAQGNPGPAGTSGSGTASVSAVTPSSAFVGRTVDLSVAGYGTSWSSKTTVAFADPAIKVNKVTAASATGLLVNVTVGATANIGVTDVTVTDSGNAEAYKGAFQVKAPLEVSIDQAGGVPQGGFAAIHATVLDTSTPLDANNLSVTLGSSTDVLLGAAPTASGDFALDFLVAADVLAAAGESVDVVVTSGPTGSTIDSGLKGAFKVAARAPTTIVAGTPATGNVATTSDTSLYEFTPAAAALRFVQYNVSSPTGGGAEAIVLPKSGKYTDSLGAFVARLGTAVTSTDPTFGIVTDSGNPFAAPPPYAFSFSVLETPCTALTFSGTHTDATTALAVATLPALASGNLGAGTTTTGDWYAVTVANGKTLHAASGGDSLSAVSLTLWDVGAVNSTPDAGDDIHKDVTLVAAAAGTYYVQVMPDATYYDPTHPAYDLFVEVK